MVEGGFSTLLGRSHGVGRPLAPMLTLEPRARGEIDLNESVNDALRNDMVVDITTVGRKSGEQRRIEIWAHSLEGRVLITGSPGKRSWYANMLAGPNVTLHLKGDVLIDLPATARPVTDAAERRKLLTAIKDASGFEQRRTMDVEAWVRGSCLVKLILRR